MLCGTKGGNGYLPIPYTSVTSPILSGLYPYSNPSVRAPVYVTMLLNPNNSPARLQRFTCSKKLVNLPDAKRIVRLFMRRRPSQIGLKGLRSLRDRLT